MGEGAALVDPEVVRHASAAVLHYFKHELQRQFVSVGEFAVALEKVLRSFGLSVYADFEAERWPAPKKQRRVLESNLHQLASSRGCRRVRTAFLSPIAPGVADAR